MRHPSLLVVLFAVSATVARAEPAGEKHPVPDASEVRDELKGPHANLVKADADESGGLDQEEFRTFIDGNAAISFGVAKRIKSWGAYGIAFGRADTNSDGVLIWSEFETAQQ